MHHIIVSGPTSPRYNTQHRQCSVCMQAYSSSIILHPPTRGLSPSSLSFTLIQSFSSLSSSHVSLSHLTPLSLLILQARGHPSGAGAPRRPAQRPARVQVASGRRGGLPRCGLPAADADASSVLVVFFVHVRSCVLACDSSGCELFVILVNL
jgi:hypothetical protein